MMKTMKKVGAEDGRKSFAVRPVVQKKKKERTLPMKNPKAAAIKKINKSVSRPLQKHSSTLEVSRDPKYVPVVEKNDKETLELFEIAKKSADVANTKGLLASKAETSICVDTLSLLLGFSISATAPETRRIMERLAHLTRHKDRKICNSASALFQHWSQSIRDQQH